MVRRLKNKWCVIPRPNPTADIKLICIPYAGGSASIYIPWINYLPHNVELVIIQPPGRSSRISETPLDNMSKLINEMGLVLPKILNKPYILFGHSLGSKIAFEIIRKSTSLHIPHPMFFIASGSAGPQKKNNRDITYNLNDDEFISKLEEMDGTPKDVINNKELMSIVLPTLKADFKISETYQFTGNKYFNIPLSVLGGEYDVDINLDDLKLWQYFFNSTSEITIFSGGHFFINSHKEEVLEKINEIISLCLLSIK